MHHSAKEPDEDLPTYKPDTCDCKLAYDDSDHLNDPAHFLRPIRVCKLHKNLKGKALAKAVKEHNISFFFMRQKLTSMTEEQKDEYMDKEKTKERARIDKL